MPTKPYVLLDRDGTMIVERSTWPIPPALRCCRELRKVFARCKRPGSDLAVVTNQSGIGRGLLRRNDAGSAVHARMRELLAGENVTLDGIYYCPHVDEDGCNCRKPRTGLAEQAARELGFDVTRTYRRGRQGNRRRTRGSVGSRQHPSAHRIRRCDGAKRKLSSGLRRRRSKHGGRMDTSVRQSK